MRIGLVGHGMIGSTFARWQKSHTSNEVKIYDPDKGFQDSFEGVDAIVICVPVPTLPSRIQDTSQVEATLRRFKDLNVPVFIRSTVLPGTCDRLARMYELDIYHLPEFLTERTADSDFRKHMIVVGTPESYPEGLTSLILKMFPQKTFMTITNAEAEIAKYTSNCFGALKVNYFNMIFKLCEKLGASYSNVLSGAMTPGFIEPTHTQVPGPDGRFGFGGHCLPKDLTAFIGILAENQIMNASLRRVEVENKLNRDFSFNEVSVNNLPI